MDRWKQKERGRRIEMDLGEICTESEFVEFWPLQHPTEPLDEDKPLKCPISDTSLVNNSRRRREERFPDRLEKRGEFYSAVVQKQAADEEPTVGAVRKRHYHTLTSTTTHEDQDNALLRMSMPPPPPVYPYSVQPQKLTIFDMMQHFNKFQS